MKEKQKIGILSKLLRRKKVLVVIILVLVIGAIITSRFIANKRKNGDAATTEIKRGTVVQEMILSGEINAEEYAKITFGASGKISWIGVKEGQEVKRGQALAKLDTVSLNASYQQARATLRAAEATVENIHDQVKGHSGDETYVQKDTRTTAEVTKDKAYEAFIAAQDALKNATIFAPFGGIITTSFKPYSGVTVLYTEPIFELINPATIYFEVTADQNEVIDISLGQPVKLVFDSYPDEEFQGEVTFISYVPEAGEIGTLYKIKVLIDDYDLSFSKFRIGMTGDAKFVLSEKSDVLFVEPKFINSDKNGKFLNVGKIGNKVYVEVGLEGEDAVEITGDIKEGDKIYD